VTCSATDAHGNRAIDVAFTVSVINTPPTFVPPANIIAEATGAAGALVSFAAIGHDAEQGSIPASCSQPSGSTFPIGMTTVKCVVTDVAGVSATGSFNVIVRDTTAPSVTKVKPGLVLRWPFDHGFRLVTIHAVAADAVTSEPACRITSVTSNERPRKKHNQADDDDDDRDSPDDWRIIGRLALLLRADNGRGNGRNYVIGVQCTDAAGNAAAATTTVVVSKSGRH
jgi:hypothetical protein